MQCFELIVNFFFSLCLLDSARVSARDRMIANAEKPRKACTRIIDRYNAPFAASAFRFPP
jgi:hypothetical protein